LLESDWNEWGLGSVELIGRKAVAPITEFSFFFFFFFEFR
jgi:hypothetical protein